MKRKNDTSPTMILPTWAVMLIVIVMFDLLLAFEYCCIVKIPSPVGAICGLVVVADLLIWGILSVGFSKRAPSVSIIDERELSNAMRLLRYATAILSFLSLMTTASGMKSFVFDTDWKAYLGSFAVQSILVVFSLLLCHFYVMIGTLSHFGKAAKALMLSALTVFFAAALVVSSCFSYVYISGNAYKNSWTGDSETLIQEYLLRETAELKERNALLGEQFLKNIGADIQITLEGDIKSYSEKKEAAVLEEVSKFQLEGYADSQSDLEKINITANIERLNEDRGANPVQLEEIQSAYNIIGWDVMVEAFKEYENAVTKVSALVNPVAGTGGTALEEMTKELSDISSSLQKIIDDVGLAISNVDGLSTSNYRFNIIPIRNTFNSRANTFKNFVQRQKDDLDDLIARINIACGDTSNSGEISVTDQLEVIRRKIYLLNSKRSDLDSEIQDIVGSLSGLLAKLSESDAVTTESIASLTSLSERINEYGKSLALSNDIQAFMGNDLGQMYSFDENSEVEKEEWRATRDEDFRQFLSMLHELPDPLLLEETYQNEHTQKEYRDAATILKEAEIIRRDLLGQLTAFEKSLNYFKYDFRKMAFFSAFVAVFLDLGAFLTGCFLYSARHIRKGKIGDDSENSEPEPEPKSKSELEKETSKQ